MTRRIYLAHPLDHRAEVRAKELEIEKRTGVELLNPFYDTGRTDIHEIDAGRLTRWDVPASEIVEKDIGHIRECDEFAAVLCDGLSIGTIMEIVYAHLEHKKVMVIDCAGKGAHPWIRHHADVILEGWDEFEEYLDTKGCPLLEKLAELEHRQWADWAREILISEPDLTPQRRARWMELKATRYEDLSESQKDADRIHALRFLRILEKEGIL